MALPPSLHDVRKDWKGGVGHFGPFEAEVTRPNEKRAVELRNWHRNRGAAGTRSETSR